MRGAAALSLAATLAAVGSPPAAAAPSVTGVVSYAVLSKGSVGKIVGAPIGWEAVSGNPYQAFWVDNPVCNNWADIGLPEVYHDPDLAAFNSAVTQTSATDQTRFAKQAVGVFATPEAADRAFHRVTDRTVGCSGQTTAMHLANGITRVWTFDGTPASGTDATRPQDTAWTKQEAGTDWRCFSQTRLRENALLQARVCQSGDGGPAVNVLAGAMQNTLGR